jgi:hypothetical protein
VVRWLDRQPAKSVWYHDSKPALVWHCCRQVGGEKRLNRLAAPSGLRRSVRADRQLGLSHANRAEARAAQQRAKGCRRGIDLIVMGASRKGAQFLDEDLVPRAF